MVPHLRSSSGHLTPPFDEPSCPPPQTTVYRTDGRVHEKPPVNEARSYYFGLPSTPRLVATTSWAPPPLDLWRHRKSLSAVSNDHAISQYWHPNSNLSREILQSLHSCPWTAIDILRVRCDVAEDRLLLLISVRPGAMDWATAIWLVTNCKRVLDYYGLSDMEVEMKESTLNSANDQVSSPQPNLDKPAPPDPQPLFGAPIDFASGMFTDKKVMVSDLIGTCITRSRDFHASGSKSLYLLVRASDRAPFHAALTCRHILEPSVLGAEQYRWFEGQEKIGMSQMTMKQVQDARQNFMDMVETLQEAKGLLKQAEQRGDGMKIERLNKNVRDREAFIPELAILDNHLADHPTLESRRFGHLVFAAKMDAPDAWLRDYAVIELDKRQHPRPPENRVFAPRLHMAPGHAKGIPVAGHTIITHMLDDEVTMKLSDYLTEEQILAPKEIPTAQCTQEGNLLVAKYGATTGFTFGQVNGVKSVTRRLDQEVTSWEICVVGLEGSFSKPSDSGACVWSLDGKIVGMMTSGTEGENKDCLVVDITYVTSLEKILGDMRESGFEASIL